MKNFIFKSTAADLQKMFQLIETIQKNVLYITYRVDMLIKRYDKLEVDKGLQTQVDDYFDEHHDAYEEEHPPNSPTTHPGDND